MSSRLDGLQILAKYKDISYADLHNRIRGALDWVHEWRATPTGYKHLDTYDPADVAAKVAEIREERT